MAGECLIDATLAVKHDREVVGGGSVLREYAVEDAISRVVVKLIKDDRAGVGTQSDETFKTLGFDVKRERRRVFYEYYIA